MEKYDGWTIKVMWHTYPWLLTIFFRPTRTEAIKAFEEEWNENWRKCRRKGEFRAVKVKLVEIDSVASETRYPNTNREEKWIRIK